MKRNARMALHELRQIRRAEERNLERLGARRDAWRVLEVTIDPKDGRPAFGCDRAALAAAFGVEKLKSLDGRLARVVYRRQRARLSPGALAKSFPTIAAAAEYLAALPQKAVPKKLEAEHVRLERWQRRLLDPYARMRKALVAAETAALTATVLAEPNPTRRDQLLTALERRLEGIAAYRRNRLGNPGGARRGPGSLRQAVTRACERLAAGDGTARPDWRRVVEALLREDRRSSAAPAAASMRPGFAALQKLSFDQAIARALSAGAFPFKGRRYSIKTVRNLLSLSSTRQTAK